jgi:hypothetical protein
MTVVRGQADTVKGAQGNSSILKHVFRWDFHGAYFESSLVAVLCSACETIRSTAVICCDIAAATAE